MKTNIYPYDRPETYPEKDEIGDFLEPTKQEIHEGKMPFECDLCDAKFTYKGHVNRHIASVHEGKKRLK